MFKCLGTIAKFVLIGELKIEKVFNLFIYALGVPGIHPFHAHFIAFYAVASHHQS